MAQKPVIQVRDLVKFYGDFQALKGISFDVNQGEILGLLGPNGAGKSTTMKILTSYISATSGQVTVDGIDLFKDPIAVRRLIGYLPESTPLYTDMLVYDYLVYIAQMRGIDKKTAAKRIAELAGKVGIREKISKGVNTLSKGYRQRVGLAQALIHNPKIVILDEPTSGLDPNQIVEIRNVIKELGKDHTIILSTHILPEVRQTCDRIVIIHEGEKVVDGRQDELEGSAIKEHRLVVGVAANGTDSAAIRDQLGALPGIDSVSLGAPGKLPTEHYTYEIRASKDARPAIFKWAQTDGHDLIELTRKARDLENIFQELTVGQ
jgi:ABC-2 type transport system ATP-binding protein